MKSSARARAMLFVVAVVALALVTLDRTAPSASAFGWEKVKNFAPEKIETPPPAEWSEDVQLGGVSGMAVNRTGAGGVEPGTLYAAGYDEGDWHVARFSPKGAFELGWRQSKRCGPEAGGAPPPKCPPVPTAPATGIDVDINQTTGDVYVFAESIEAKVIRVYKADGTGPIAEFGEPDFNGLIATSPTKFHRTTGVGSIAVNDEGRVYLFDEDKNFVHRLMIFKPKTTGVFTEYEYGGEIIGGPFGQLEPLSPVLDDAGNVYTRTEGSIEEHSPTGTPLCEFEEPKSGITSITVNPVTGEPFYYSYKDLKIHQLGPCSEGKFAPVKDGEFSAVPQRGAIEAMAFNPTLVWEAEARPAGVLYAGAAGPCPPVGGCPAEAKGQSSLGYVFAGPASHEPVVESESVSKVRPSGATLNAIANPKGALSTYVFQYMTRIAYEAEGETFTGASEAPLGGATLGSGQLPLLASVAISGLSPDTEYVYRVIVESEEGSDEGAAQAFRTFPVTSDQLADERAYELVSPAQKKGGEVIPANPELASCGSECKPGLASARFPALVAPDSNSVAYQGQPFFFNEGAIEYDEYVSTRTGSGWQTTSLSPPMMGDDGGAGFQAFGLDGDLGQAIVFARNEALTPEAPSEYPNFFLEQTSNRFGPSPLLTNTNATLHRSPGTGPEGLKLPYAGASADYSRQFFEANDALTAEAEDGGLAKFNLYEWSAGQLHVVNLQPGNVEAIPGAAFGSGFLLGSPSPPAANFSHAISTDGSRVFWTGADGKTYVRVGGSETLEVPGPGTCKESVSAPSRVCFLTASPDGSEVLLSNGQLYRLNEGGAYEATTDLTGGLGGFQGISGQSADLSHLYFVLGPAKGSGDLTSGSTTITNLKTTSGTFSAGQAIEGTGIPAGTTIAALGAGTLQISAPATATTPEKEDTALAAQALPSGEEENSAGDEPQLGGFNLYSWQSGAPATTKFVATLLVSDNNESGVWSAAPVRRRAETSPDGRWLAFNSAAELTGVDSVGACVFDPDQNKFVLPGACQEVFLYDSANGQLTCPSCNPTGAAPLGASILRTELHATGSLPQPRYLTNAGRLYFDSRDALSSLDTNNGVEDVYEFEPQGVGSCLQAGGCVSLISNGRGAFDANLLTMDVSGDNVFFTTRNSLLPVDVDQLIDVYDARVGGGIAEPESQLPCQGDGCQPPSPPPPARPLLGSTSFEGPGNATGKKNKKPQNKKSNRKKKNKKHKNGKRKQFKSKRGGQK